METEADRTHGIPRISVCMATYNGARFITAQLESILDELGIDDEVVIVDDCSSDDTRDIVRRIGDPRVRMLENSRNLGYVRTFERALTEARGSYIMLSDQDDIWKRGRAEILVAALADRAFVASNLDLLGEARPISGPLGIGEWRLPRSGRNTPIRNTLGILYGIMPYFGCAMAMRREALAAALPFPKYLYESHDLWLAIVANRLSQMRHVPEVTIHRRLHESNTSPNAPRGVRAVLKSRLLVLRMIASSRGRSLPKKSR